MRCVEFIGPPGVGKTTLVNEVAAVLARSASSTVFTPEEAAFHVAKHHGEPSVARVLRVLPQWLGRRVFRLLEGRTLWQQDAIFRFVVQKHKLIHELFEAPAMKSRAEADRLVVLSGLLRSGGLLASLERGGGDDAWVLFDEGMLQKSMMLVGGDSAGTEEALRSYLSQVEMPDLVVLLDAAADTCVARMMGRSKGLTARLKLKSDEERSVFLQNSALHWRRVARYLAEETTVPVLSVDAGQEKSLLVCRLVDELTGVISGAPGQGTALPLPGTR
ncbi:hypothetical protein [Geomonas subterranea]|uniref:hypothetical protein n=1 Tax=Geomonas subterranea TaxID=2847989 RepID=UPI001CD28746|nr:hypothetical protein [Geomonas fuzhouensis]